MFFSLPSQVVIPLSRRDHPRSPWHAPAAPRGYVRAAQPPHCARVHTRLCGVIKMMSLRDIAQACVCRAATISTHAQCHQAFVPAGTQCVRGPCFYRYATPDGVRGRDKEQRTENRNPQIVNRQSKKTKELLLQDKYYSIHFLKLF